MESRNLDKRKEEIRRAWSALDQNGDNQVNASELVRGARIIGLNPTLDEAKKLIKEIDEDKNGYISFQEFEDLMTIHYDVLEYQEHEIRAAFKRFDTEGKGYLNRKQLDKALKNIGDQLTEEECEEFFNLTDKNHDGKIDIEGYYKFVGGTNPGSKAIQFENFKSENIIKYHDDILNN